MPVTSAPSAKQLVGRDVSVRFDGLAALDSVSVAVERGKILGLIGPNGAGKTTLVNALTGFQRVSTGYIAIDPDIDITSASPERIARLGVARTFQNVRLFREFTVAENVICAGIGVGFGKRRAASNARDILDWLDLSERAERLAETLPYGEERKVGIARALGTNPSFLLLDEPAAGLNDAECEAMMTTIRRIPERFGTGILLIEHNMRVIMTVCDRVHVIDFGKTIAEGTPQEIKAHPDVIRAYLGIEQ
jgi:branched-chain amino acid transport system ATP-binding protein